MYVDVCVGAECVGVGGVCRGKQVIVIVRVRVINCPPLFLFLV